MRPRWRLYRFDHDRFESLRPALTRARTPEDFAALADDAPTRAVAAACEMEGEAAAPEAVRALFVEAACCLGDPLPLERGFTRLLSALARHREGADAADSLRDLLLNEKNLPAWMRPGSALRGLLSPEETLRLRMDFARIPRLPGRRRRRGGLLGLARGFLSSLFDQAPREQETLALLRALLDEAVRNGEGVAAVAE